MKRHNESLLVLLTNDQEYQFKGFTSKSTKEGSQVTSHLNVSHFIFIISDKVRTTENVGYMKKGVGVVRDQNLNLEEVKP